MKPSHRHLPRSPAFRLWTSSRDGIGIGLALPGLRATIPPQPGLGMDCAIARRAGRDGRS
jgi:hypothetical protein